MNRRLLIATLGVLLSGLTGNALAAASPPVRKATSSGICHDASSSSYNRMKDYTTFGSLTECVASGGRLLKSAAPPCQPVRKGSAKALYDTDDISIVKKSRDGLCLSATDATFSSILKVTAYASVEDCVADGGHRSRN